jgi:peptidase E
MNLHLFSTAGEDGLDEIVAVCRPYLEKRSEASVAYLPLASLSPEKWLAFTEKAFNGLARLATLNTESMSEPDMEAILRRAHLVLIPGGNTYLLNHRLHLSQLMPFLRKKILGGLPLAAFSAGTVLCGANILTANDVNMVDTPYFKGLEVTPFNFNVHYPVDPLAQAARDGWLSDYHVFHDNPVLLLADGAYVQVEKGGTRLVRGEAWILRAGIDKEKLETGLAIKLNPVA